MAHYSTKSLKNSSQKIMTSRRSNMLNNSNHSAFGYMSKAYNYDAAQSQPDHYMTIEESIGANYMNGVFRITAVNMKLAKNNEPFVILRLSDKTGDIDGILWPERKAH